VDKKSFGLAALVAALALGAAAQPYTTPARGFPEMRTLSGEKLASGEYVAWIEHGQYHLSQTYRFPDGRIVEEQTSFDRSPLAQKKWSWRETQNGVDLRRFEVDFASGKATAMVTDKSSIRTWMSKIDVKDGKTFCGLGFVQAIVNDKPKLVAGENLKLKAVAFTPKPRVVDVEVSYSGVDQMTQASQTLKGDHYVIAAKLPVPIKLFVKPPDNHVWLTHLEPSAFLRSEGPLMQPDDQKVRIDLLPGGISTPATRLPAS
jgi:hypothetical protein